MNNPMAQVYKKRNFLTQDRHSDDFGLKNPVIQKTFFLAETCYYLYRRTRHPGPYGSRLFPPPLPTPVHAFYLYRETGSALFFPGRLAPN